MFYVGQKVVCIKDKPTSPSGYGDEAWPVKGCVYTIRTLCCRGFVRLVEIVNDKREYRRGWSEVSFAKDGFRPLVDRPTSLEWVDEIIKGVETRSPVLEGV